jgi:transposase, IS5 family
VAPPSQELEPPAIPGRFIKVSVATTLHRSRGGQFLLHAKALPGNPYDDHTLAEIIPDMEKSIGNGIQRLLTDAG